ncbi:MAG: glycoside hydrolase, partial [bacterium]
MARIFERYEARARKILDDNWTGSFTRPSSGLYPHQWNWDSGFIAIGRSHYDTQGAISEIESLFAGQWQNGMVPQIVFDPDALGHYFPEPDFWQVERSPSAPRGIPTSGITMPPIHAVAVEAIWDNASRKREVRAFLESIFPRLMDLHDYLYRERDPGRTGLVAIRHPWESGIDNSPAWDEPLRSIRIQPDLLPPYRRLDLEHVPSGMRPSDEDYDRYVYLVDLFRRLDYDEASIRSQCPFLVLDPLFNSILSRANRSLARLAGILGLRQERIQAWERRTSEAIRTTLWCPDRSMFYPRDAHTGRFIYADTSSGFLPLYAGAATREQAEHLYRRLDSVSFCALHQGNCYTVPNYDTQKEDFDRSNYWRGPVWININWMLAHGLARYGYTLKADSLRRDLLQLPIRFGFHEYFDSFSGEGYGSRDFS